MPADRATEVDPTQLALLGHSMGSGVAMTAAVAQPRSLRGDHRRLADQRQRERRRAA